MFLRARKVLQSVFDTDVLARVIVMSSQLDPTQMVYAATAGVDRVPRY